MSGYSRQSAGEFTTGATINASDFENEFAALATAFGNSGHDHSGSGGNGAQIPLTTSVTGVLPLANGGTGANLSDPGADRIVFWDDSASSTAFLEPDANFSISGTTLSLSEDLTTTDLIASGSAGIVIKNSGGSAVITAGGGAGTGVSFAGGVTIAGQLTASANFVFDGTTHTGTTGADVKLVSGTAGTSGNVAMWNADGDVVDGSAVAANLLVSGDIGSTVQAYDVDTLKADTTDELTVGYSATVYNAGTQSSGTFTPDEANGNKQRCVNGGSFTLAPPTNYTNIEVLMTNNASAGTVTTSGFTRAIGDPFTTTDGDEFLLQISTTTDGTSTFSLLNVIAMQ